MTFDDKLSLAAQKNGSWLCIGLDPRVDDLPSGLPATPNGVLRFCRNIVNATSDLVCAYKPNIAFFERLGDDGWKTLARLIESIPAHIPVILDAKRGDIVSTAEQYAHAYYDILNVDAVTVNPYMGWDAVAPFATRDGKCAIVLCLTSNSSAKTFQGKISDGQPLFMAVAREVAKWDGNCGLVVGATQVQDLADIRAAAPKLPILIPGVGAQGGDLEKSLIAGKRQDGTGAIISVSRGVIAASKEANFAERASVAAESYRKAMGLVM